jgi:thiaminase/transcriptional activator TenA
MSLTEVLRRSVGHIWEKIFNHPFVVELYLGTLPLEKFKYYVIQDYNYLITMYRCFSLIASKADYELARKALELAYIEATTEMANYERLLNKLGISFDEVVNTEPAPTNMAYMNFLISTCALRTPLEGLIALLPCFWSYAEIAERHKGKLISNKNELYVEWAKVYLSEDYLKLIKDLRDFIDKSAKSLDVESAKKLFRIASRYEYLFWDMAYRMESWYID